MVVTFITHCQWLPHWKCTVTLSYQIEFVQPYTEMDWKWFVTVRYCTLVAENLCGGFDSSQAICHKFYSPTIFILVSLLCKAANQPTQNVSGQHSAKVLHYTVSWALLITLNIIKGQCIKYIIIYRSSENMQ